MDDETDKDFTDSIVRTAELVIPRKRQKGGGERMALDTTSKQILKTPNFGKRSAGLVL